MDFSLNVDGSALTGSINPEAMMGMTTVLGAFLGGFAMLWVTIYIAIVVLMIISRWKLLTKAKLPGRGIFIPVYNLVLMFKLGGLSGRWVLSILFPPLFLVAMIVNYFKIAEKFGKHWTFGLGMLFVKIVFIPILAFDNSKYMGTTTKETIKTTPVTPAKKVVVKKVIIKKPTKKVVKKVVKKAPAKKTTTKKPVKKVKTLTKKK